MDKVEIKGTAFDRDSFFRYIREGQYQKSPSECYKPICATMTVENDGGFLIPETITVKRSGILGALCRWIKHPYGWKTVHPVKEILAKAYAAKVST